jgi:Protein tyrosine and serine/threonine kinase
MKSGNIGNIMTKPLNCNDFLYKLMKDCWKFESPKRRLKFKKCKFLANFFNQSTKSESAMV